MPTSTRDRIHDVGIAEQHAVTLAAGMAIDGLQPVVAIYSTFLQRAYDQLIHDVAIQNVKVLFAVDRAGIVGPDGATHTGQFDISFCRSIPNLIIMTPANATDMHALLNTAFDYQGPSLVRYPRDNTAIAETRKLADKSVKIGESELVKEGKTIAVLVFGPFLEMVLEASQDISVTVINMRFVKPLDQQRLQTAGRQP